MFVNLMGDFAGEVARGKNVFLIGVHTKHEYFQDMAVECYVALLVLLVTSLDVVCVGDFAWPCRSRCGYAHTIVMWHAPCFQVLVLWDAAMLAARKISAYQMLIENFDVCALVVSKDGIFFGLKVNDDWMMMCNDRILVFSVPMDLNQWLIGYIFFAPVGYPGNVINSGLEELLLLRRLHGLLVWVWLIWRLLLLICIMGWISFCRVLFVIGGIRLFLGGRLGFWRTLLHILIGGFDLILFLLLLFCSVILGYCWWVWCYC